MFSKLRLSHKGLLLVSLLLLFELIFVGSLVGLLNEAELATERENHSKEVVGKTNLIMQLLYDTGTAASDYQTCGRQPEAAERFHAGMDKIPVEFGVLKDTVKDNPDYLQRVKKIEKSATSTLKLVAFAMKFAEAGDMPTAAMAAQKIKPRFQKMRKEMFDDLRSLMDDQEKIIQESPKAQARNRLMVKQLLFGGLAVNVFIALLLAVVFVRGITRRLDLMVANTELLAKNQPLLPEMQGTDEIAALDRSFHEMARSLKELEELKRQFVAMVSHDLRTPLTSLKLYLEMVGTGAYGDLNELGNKRTAIAERSVQRLIGLINDLLDAERLESGQMSMSPKNIKVYEAMQRCRDAVGSFAETNEVKLELLDTALEAYADPDRVVQVLVNLAANAVKFSPAGTCITLSAVELGEFVQVRVQDQGRGIPEEFKDKIFERFKQVKKTDASEKGGTGLGLAICKAIVDAHGGKIGVDSKEGEGSCFWFTLPAPGTSVMPAGAG